LQASLVFFMKKTLLLKTFVDILLVINDKDSIPPLQRP